MRRNLPRTQCLLIGNRPDRSPTAGHPTSSSVIPLAIRGDSCPHQIGTALRSRHAAPCRCSGAHRRGADSAAGEREATNEHENKLEVKTFYQAKISLSDAIAAGEKSSSGKALGA